MLVSFAVHLKFILMISKLFFLYFINILIFYITCVKVGGSDMDEDGLEGRMEPDNGDISRDKSYLMKTGSIGALSQKGRRLYGKKLEADSTKDNHLDEIREACSGTEEGQIVGVDRGKSYSEVTEANIARSSQGLRKRSKKVLFRRGI